MMKFMLTGIVVREIRSTSFGAEVSCYCLASKLRKSFQELGIETKDRVLFASSDRITLIHFLNYDDGLMFFLKHK